MKAAIAALFRSTVNALYMASNETIVERESVFITLLVLWRVYPSDDPNGVLGVRKSDGITVSLIYHGYQQENDIGLSKHLRSAANACYGSIFPKGINVTNYNKGLVCLGTSVLRASRRRCDLYKASQKSMSEFLTSYKTYRLSLVSASVVSSAFRPSIAFEYASKLPQSFRSMTLLRTHVKRTLHYCRITMTTLWWYVNLKLIQITSLTVL